MSFSNSCSESNAPPSFNYFEYQVIQCNEALYCFCIIIFQGIYISRRNRPYGRKCFGNCTRSRSPFHRIIVPPHNKVIITTVFLSPPPPPYGNIHRDKSSVITCSVYSCEHVDDLVYFFLCRNCNHFSSDFSKVRHQLINIIGQQKIMP